LIKAPGDWLNQLAEVAVAIAEVRKVAAPAEFGSVQPSDTARQIAASLLSGERRAIVLGNAVAQHPQAVQLHGIAQWIAQQMEGRLAYLTEGANTIGGYLAKALPASGQLGFDFVQRPAKGYLLMHAEPELDCANPQAARAAMDQAEMVVVMSPFKHGMDYADVLLPIAPYSETSGTFVSAEGRAQSFNGSVRPLGDTRPGWKVLRVLGNLLSLPEFDYDTSEAVRNEVLGANTLEGLDLSARLSNSAAVSLPLALQMQAGESGLQRVAEVPVYFSDAITRRAPALQQTRDAQPPRAVLSAALAAQLGVGAGDLVSISQGQASVHLPCVLDASLPTNVVRVAAAHSSTAALGAMFGTISVEKL
jgi:NADH-quinone oxidoreductase subunit G